MFIQAGNDKSFHSVFTIQDIEKPIIDRESALRMVSILVYKIN